jgi:hypothetical protein
MGLRVDQRLVDPVRHLLGPAQPVAVTGQKDSRRAIGRGIEELVFLAPRNSTAVLRHPGVDELGRQRRQRSRTRNAGEAIGSLQGQRQPRHIVVIAIGPAAVVAGEVAADLALDGLDPFRPRVANLGVDQGVQQVRLPPVMPGAEV